MTTENNQNLEKELAAFEHRRQHKRMRLVIDLYFDGHDATGVASLKEISLGGLYMNTSADIAEGALLHLRIPFSNGEQVVAKAEVVYTNPNVGVGVKFVEISDEDRALLDRKLSELEHP